MSQSINKSTLLYKVKIFPTHFFLFLIKTMDDVKNVAQLLCDLRIRLL